MSPRKRLAPRRADLDRKDTMISVQQAAWALLGFGLVVVGLMLGRPSLEPASATMPGASGPIVFVHAHDGIYTVNPDGSGLRRVTKNTADFMPEWSPDASSIAFSRGVNRQRPGGATIWITDAAGTNPRQLTPTDTDSSDFWPRFTPDGNTIVFTNCLGEGCDGGIFAIQADGTGRRVITPNAGTSYNQGVPSPAGDRIAFMRWHVGGAMMRIYVMRTDGSHQRAVTPIRLEANDPDWAPDGSTLLFASNINRPGGAIYTIRPDGRGLHRLTNPKFPHKDAQAGYSPDGANIVFTSDRRRIDHTDLYVMPAAGGAPHRIPLPFTNVFAARWGNHPPE